MTSTAPAAIMRQADLQVTYIKAILSNIRQACAGITEDVEILENMIQSVERLAEGSDGIQNKE